MDDKVIKELKNSIEHANDGNWMPLLALAGMLVIIFGLLRYIYVRDRKTIEGRQDKQGDLMEKLTEVSTENQKIIGIHEAEINNLKRPA